MVKNIVQHFTQDYGLDSSKHYANLLQIPKNVLKGNLFILSALLKLVLPKQEHKNLVDALKNHPLKL